MLSVENKDFLAKVAQEAYGHGLLQGTKGGEGRIGMIGDRVVKFNTNSGERLRGPKANDEMRASCNQLRARLLAIASASGLSKEQVGEIRKKLGLKGNDVPAACKKLLDRKVVAKVIGMIAGEETNSIWSQTDRTAKTKSGGDMHFKTVSKRVKDDALAMAMEGGAPGKVSEAAGKLGVAFSDSERQAIIRSMSDPTVPFLDSRHYANALTLMEAIASGNLEGLDATVKDTVAYLTHLPQEKRADGLALALVVGPDDFTSNFLNDRKVDEIIARKDGNNGRIDTALVKNWADDTIAAFKERFPHAPAISRDDRFAFGRDLLGTAGRLGMILMVDDLGRADIFANADPEENLDLAGWRDGTDKGSGTVFDRLDSNPCALDRLGMNFNDRALAMHWGKGNEDVVLTMEVLRSGYEPLPLALLGEAEKRVAGDLDRTEIKASFTSPDGETKKIETGFKPKGDAAKKKAEELHQEVRRFLGLVRKEDADTPQAKQVLGMFSQYGMATMQSVSGEHIAREMEISLDGDDVLVRAKNLNEDDTIAFDFTIRIKPDGSNSYDSLDVRPKSTQQERFESGFLSTQDIRELNANPFGKGPVKARLPGDVGRLKEEFKNYAKPEVRQPEVRKEGRKEGRKGSANLDNLKSHFTRGFSYTINNTKFSVPPQDPNEAKPNQANDRQAETMAAEMEKFFGKDIVLLNVFDKFFGGALSVFENGNMGNSSAVTLIPGSVPGVKGGQKEQNLSLSRNADGSYRVSYSKRETEATSYQFFDGKDMHVIQRPETVTGGSWEYAMTFDMRMKGDGQIEILPVGVPTVSFDVPSMDEMV